MMGMMHQLLQAKSAGGGQQGEKSGGSGRGDANYDSGGAGTAPRKEGTAVVAMNATAERGKLSSHSSRASDGSRPADDMSRRPGTRVGAGTETAAGREMSSHSSGASDGSRPDDDTNRRPEVPVDVGPIIKNRDRAEIIHMVSTWFSTLPQKEAIAAIVLVARASVFLEQKRRPERCTTRSWPRSQGRSGPWPRRKQQ